MTKARSGMIQGMRATITFADDVSAVVEQFRRERSVGLSEAVNELIREGMAGRSPAQSFEQRSRWLGLRIDVTDAAEALERLEGSGSR